MPSKFEALRAQHPVFHYEGYAVTRDAGGITLRFDFLIDGLGAFHPVTRIATKNLPIVNDFDGPLAHDIVFALGLVELVSYWKCACPPEIVIHCGTLNHDEIRWWKRLWFHGLGEFFYRNGVVTDLDSFVQVRCENAPHLRAEGQNFHHSNVCLVPVGGGKDSCVTLHLLQEMGQPLLGFTVNDQPARTETFAAARFAPGQMLHTYRTIDPALLACNARDYLNGHTPFSAVVAFLGLYCAYLIGAENLVLSNEASANEASVTGTDVNHQYSKSYAFERDMNDYIDGRFGLPVRYFSLLRPFHELQIAKRFAALPQFHFAFKSCNVGSKHNVWCCNCAKCLFVYLMLAPFLPEPQMVHIFGENLLKNPKLQPELFALMGETTQGEKPFECVGTVEEARAAFALLQGDGAAAQRLLQSWNPTHLIPEKFLPAAERMRVYVGAAS
ncbi:MAG: hypothetical protein LBB50_03240 [Oscillospiraceae bacterium]|nr:hypothetical protein [Oscillospiraceae bacterium]